MGQGQGADRQLPPYGPIAVRPDMLEKLAHSLEVARVPIRLDGLRPSKNDQAHCFLPLAARAVGPSGLLGEKHPGVPVILHIYDLEIYNMDSTWISKISGLPIFHIGVEVYSLEFCYGSEGVMSMWPGTYDEEKYRLSLEVGSTRLSNHQVLEVLNELSDKWEGHKYRMVGFNCQSFALEFCKILGLGDKVIPAEYLRFADGWKPPPRENTDPSLPDPKIRL